MLLVSIVASPASVAETVSGPLILGMYLGSSETDIFLGLERAPDGGLFILGYSYDPEYPQPVSWGPSTSPNPATHGLLLKASASGQIEFGVALPMENAWRMAVGPQGNVVIAGTTGPRFQTTPGVFQPTFAGGAAEIALVSLNGTNGAIQWASYLGGNETSRGDENLKDVALDSEGNVYVAAYSTATDFPGAGRNLTQTNRSLSVMGGEAGTYIASISPDGGHLRYGSFMGGFQVSSMAVGPSGTLVAAGVAGTALALPGGFQPSRSPENRNFTAMVVGVNASGNELDFATFVGGSVYENACGVALDARGRIALAGYTNSPDFPTTQGPPLFPGERWVGFVAELSPEGSKLEFATLLSSMGYSQPCHLRYGAGGELFAAGSADASTLSTAGTWDSGEIVGAVCPNCASNDGFVVAYSAADRSRTFQAPVGGSLNDGITGMAVMLDGSVSLLLSTASSDFATGPTLSAAPGLGTHTNGHFGDGFLMRVALTRPPEGGSTLGSPTTLHETIGILLLATLILVAAAAVIVGASLWRRRKRVH